MGVGVGHGVGEPKLELGAAQVRLAVMLDEVIDAGERDVVGQEVLHGPTLHGGTDPAVLDPARPPAGRGTTSATSLGPPALPAPRGGREHAGGWYGEGGVDQNCGQGTDREAPRVATQASLCS